MYQDAFSGNMVDIYSTRNTTFAGCQYGNDNSLDIGEGICLFID